MPITRSTWVDDDGTGKSGTVINNAELQKIYNNIDAFGNGVADVVGSTDTGTVSGWAPAGFSQRNMVIRWTGATDLTVNGITAGVTGQRLVIKNSGSGVIRLGHATGGGALVYNHASSAPTPLAYSGFAEYVFMAGAWIMCAHEQGAWITPPFSAADYAAPWVVTAGQVLTCSYRLSGRTLSVNLNVAPFSVSSPLAGLTRVIPGGFTNNSLGYAMSRAANNSNTSVAALTILSAGVASMAFYPDLQGSTPWGTSVSNSSTAFNGSFEIR